MENQTSESAAVEQSGSAATSSSVSPRVLGWGIAAFVVAIFMCTHNSSGMVQSAGFFLKTLAVLVGTVVGLVGALIGDALRRFAHPDAVFTNGGFFHLIWVRLFWMAGPQLIGLLIGVVVGCTFVLR